MQSCPKNAHTGTGPTNKKGPVSANNTIAIAENIPKIPSATANISCKVENILSPSVVIKPESKDKQSGSHDLYMQHAKVLESPELAPSPARGSTGLQLPPTVQHEAVQPTESNLNNSSDNVSLSQRKQPRVGKSMERERQQQQHITMSGHYQTALDHSDDLPHFKQEFAVKREGDVKKEKDCDDIDLGFRVEHVKLERPEANVEVSPVVEPSPTPKPIDTVTVSESGDECIDYSTKRKLNDDVIELSDNSTVELASATLKRRKLMEKPVCTPKKSPPNSYKSLIKQANPPTTYPSSTSKSKLITSSINRMGSKVSCIKRRSIFKSKSALKKMRLAAKAKKRAQSKKKVVVVVEDESDKSESTNGDENVLIATKADAESSSEAIEKCDDNVEETSTENEHNEEKSMDGSSEYSGKSNIDLTIDRVAKGYFSESDIFSCLSKHRKTKSQKKLAAKLLKLGVKEKKKGKKEKTNNVPDVPEKAKPKKAKKGKSKVDGDCEEATKVSKLKKAKVDVPEKVAKKKLAKKKPELEKDPLALDETPSSTSTPKRKPKAPKKAKKVKAEEAPVIEPVAVESDEDDKTVTTLETRDEETSTTVLSSTQTINTAKSLLDETDVANNNNIECFEDINRQKQQDTLTLYKTPGYGWTTFNKTKRGKKAKFGNRKKHRLTLPNDIVIPKSTSIPRWSNGWMWEGEPFQALVFLNVSLFMNFRELLL